MTELSPLGKRLLQSAVEPVDLELQEELAEKFPGAACVFLVPNNDPLTDEELEKIRSCPILFCGPNAAYQYRKWIKENDR